MPDFAISDTYYIHTMPSVKNIRGQHIVANSVVASTPDCFEYAVSNGDVDSKIKELGVVFKNQTKQQLTLSKKSDILKGLILLQKADLKLPKIIELEDTNNGRYSFWHPKTIYFDSNFEDLILATVHEALHKNHLSLVNFFWRIPDIDCAQKLIEKHKKSIGSELRDHAFDNMYEFVACAGEKLILEEKNWSDLSPIIKTLYDCFKGPKLKL